MFKNILISQSKRTPKAAKTIPLNVTIDDSDDDTQCSFCLFPPSKPPEFHDLGIKRDVRNPTPKRGGKGM